jgi:polyhydroxyalkanoate synthase
VPLNMPVKQGVQLQAVMSIEQIGTAPRRAAHEPQCSSFSDPDHWVQYGQATDRGPTTPGIPSDPGFVAAPDNVCRRRTKISAINARDHRSAAAPGKFALAADIAGRKCATATDDRTPKKTAPIDAIDIEQLSKNLVRLIELGGKAMAAYLKPREERQLDSVANGEVIASGEVIGVARTFSHVAEYWLAHPHRAIEVQANLGKAYFDLWLSATKRMLGEQAEPVAKSDPQDRRFSDPEWSSNPFFDFLKQAYLLTSQWANRLVKDTRWLDAHTRQKAEFYVRQFTDASSPANFVLTNPELLRETLSSNAGSLVDGMRMLVEDIEAGRGRLKIRQSDCAKFEVGRNLAITPGKVIYQNELMQLIQYVPTTRTVLKRPLLIVPPWINKYYILDLTPEKSFVKWCVDQGLTVFMISWVNPDAKLAAKGFDDYMREGPLEALKVIATATGEEKVHTIGYCAGGTLLAVMLAYMAAKGDNRALSATLCAAQVDFTYAGDIKAFIDEEQIQALERQMSQTGFLEGHKMAMAFNLLRSNDLVWPYVINNYLKGKAPRPFDLLRWNSDVTRIPVASHSFYLRNCYLENKLARGEMVLAGETIDLGNVTIPLYSLATREDHIAPAKSVFLGSKCFGGPVKFVVAGSGHIAGVINPPYQIKYSHWTDGPAVSNLETWLAKAEERPGSWWPHWLRWIREQDQTEVSARNAGGGKLEPLEDAPGSYVRVKD